MCLCVWAHTGVRARLWLCVCVCTPSVCLHVYVPYSGCLSNLPAMWYVCIHVCECVSGWVLGAYMCVCVCVCVIGVFV